jgi:hypothetical protein
MASVFSSWRDWARTPVRQTKYYDIGIRCFSVKYTSLRSKDSDGVVSIKFDIYVLIVVECDFCIVIKWLMNPLLLFVSFSLSLLLGNCRYLGTPVTSDIPIIERRYAKKKLKMIRLSIIYTLQEHNTRVHFRNTPPEYTSGTQHLSSPRFLVKFLLLNV